MIGTYDMFSREYVRMTDVIECVHNLHFTYLNTAYKRELI